MILDLYLGSLREFFQHRQTLVGVQWRPLTEAGVQPLLARATAHAFSEAPEVDQQSYRRIVADFPGDRSFLRSNCWLALRDEQPAAACLVSLRRHYCADLAYPYVDLVAVDSRWQKSGLGTALLHHTLATLVASGYRGPVHAHIRRGNSASERLFSNSGFLRWSSERYGNTGGNLQGPETSPA